VSQLLPQERKVKNGQCLRPHQQTSLFKRSLLKLLLGPILSEKKEEATRKGSCHESFETLEKRGHFIAKDPSHEKFW